MGSNNSNIKRSAWNCEHCHATNVTVICGCAASRTNLPTLSVIAIDDIHIDMPVRKSRKGAR